MIAAPRQLRLPSQPRAIARAGKLLLIGFLLAAGWQFLLAGRSVQAQRETAKALPPGGSEWNYMIRSWQSQDGLAGETVQAFAQTPDGYLWVGTNEGLLRFDGAHFRLFSHENTPAFGSDNVFCLLTGRDGHLWIGTMGTEGGGLIELRNGVFRAYPVEKGQSVYFVRSLLEDSNGLLLVATDDGLFWSRNDRLERADKPLGLPSFNVFTLLKDHTGRIWVGGGRLYSLKDGKAHEYMLPGIGGSNQLRSLVETDDGVIWAATLSGLYRLRPGRNRFDPVPGVFGTIRTLRVAPSGELWAGAIGEGIFKIRGDRVTRLKAPAPLISNTVLSIFVDSDQNLWIGTQAGMMRLSRTPVHILDLPQAADSDFGTVALDADGSLWAASNQLVHVQGDRAYPYRFPALGDARVRNLLRSRDGSIWIGTDGSGVYHLSAHATQHFTMQNGLASNFVRVLLESKDSSMWIGADGGLSHLDRTGFHNFTRQNGLPYSTVHALLEDRDGTIWIGTNRGLSAYRNGALVHDATTSALGSEDVYALHQDADGGMWIGTHVRGLYRYRDGHLSHYTTANGMGSDEIDSILEDNQGHLWISSSSGVMLLNRQQLDAKVVNPAQPLTLRIFPANEGGKSAQFYGGMQPSGVLTRTGEAWFPTSQGLWGIRPDKLEHALISNLNIDAVTVDGHPAPLSGKLNLNADSDRVEIAYAPVLLRSQDGLRFRYRLDGYDRNWTYTNGQQRLATYTNLPAGNYTFHVEAWETDHPEHVIGASIKIHKKQHFYQTLWFSALCLLAVALVSLLVYRARMKQIQERFKAVLAERTRLAREMHDTLIQGCVGVSALLKAASSGEIEDSESRSHLIEYAATQIHSTVDEARQAVWNLRSDEHTQIDLEMALRHMAGLIGHEYGVAIVCRVLGPSFPMGLKTQHELMMVARESIFNAVLHGKAQKIEVEVAYLPDLLTVVIKDDGQGFDVSAAFSEGHFGLLGIRERIRGLDGKLEIRSAPGLGASVQIEVPRTAVAA